jgi:peptidoglycan/LPS O-acetylase OafA/YrhL
LINFYGGLFTVVVTMPFAFMLAVFSWHFIEKPILSLRKKFSFAARIREIDEKPPSWPEDLGQTTLREAA